MGPCVGAAGGGGGDVCGVGSEMRRAAAVAAAVAGAAAAARVGECSEPSSHSAKGAQRLHLHLHLRLSLRHRLKGLYLHGTNSCVREGGGEGGQFDSKGLTL